MKITRLPLGAGLSTPHIPIWTSANLATTKRIIVYIGETMQDLGVLAYRTIGKETIGAGSIINLVKAVQAYPDHPGLIVANTGQLLWFRGGQKALTATSWEAIPKSSAVSPVMEIDEEINRVRGNATPDEHVRSIFEEVIVKMTNKDAAIGVIGSGDGALVLVNYLQNNWPKWANRIQAAAIGTNFVWEGVKVDDRNFKDFWSNVRHLSLPPSLSLTPPKSRLYSIE